MQEVLTIVIVVVIIVVIIAVLAKVASGLIKIAAVALAAFLIYTVIWGNGSDIVSKIAENFNNKEEIITIYDDFKEKRNEKLPSIDDWLTENGIKEIFEEK